MHVLNSLGNFKDNFADPRLVKREHTFLLDVLKKAAPRHELRHYDVSVSILVLVDEPQHISAIACSDVLQNWDFLISLVTSGIHGIQVILINQLDSDL